MSCEDRGDGLMTAEAAIDAIARGEMIVLVDAPQRENEGDLVIAAECVTPAHVNFMATHGRGLICVATTARRLERLEIPPMVRRPGDAQGTAFHVSVDARAGTTTGISAYDRARTIQLLADPAAGARDVVRPGHVFPLAARPGGVLERPGHTEASVDLARLAGLREAAVICEVAGDDGEMARLPELLVFARRHRLRVAAISDLIELRRSREPRVARGAERIVRLPQGEFSLVGYRERSGATVEHAAFCRGELSGLPERFVHVHAECVPGDLLGGDCACRARLEASLRAVAAAGRGAVVYLRAAGVGHHQPDRELAREIARDLGVDLSARDAADLRAPLLDQVA